MKNKRRAPLIVLFDILFVYLFSTVLEPAPGITLKIKGGELVPNVGLIEINENGMLFKTYLGESENIKELQNLESIKENTNWTSFPCQENKICNNPMQNKILIYGKLAEEISIITLGICIQFPSQCNSLQFFINQDGSLNRKESLRMSPILANIDGFI